MADEAKVTLGADNEPLKEDLKESEELFSEWGVAIKTALVQIGVDIAKAFGSAVIGGVKDALGAAMEAEENAARLEARLKALGSEAITTASHVQDLAGQIASYTRFEDDAVVAGATLLTSFKNIKKEATFDRIVKDAADLAEALGTDLSSAMHMVGRAIDDPEKGIMALRQAGIRLNDTTKATIEKLMEQGRVAEAQEIIFGELESRFKGVAETMASTTAGEISNMKKEFGEMSEELGTALLPLLNDLLPILKGISAFVSDVMIPAIQDLIGTYDELGGAVDRTSESFKKQQRESQTQWTASLKSGWEDFWGWMELGWKEVLLNIRRMIYDNITVPTIDAMEASGIYKLLGKTGDKQKAYNEAEFKKQQDAIDKLREDLQKKYDKVADETREKIEERAEESKKRQSADDGRPENYPIPPKRTPGGAVVFTMPAEEEKKKKEEEGPDFESSIEGLLALNRRISEAAAGNSEEERRHRQMLDAEKAAAELVKQGNVLLDNGNKLADAAVKALDKVVKGLPFVGALK